MRGWKKWVRGTYKWRENGEGQGERRLRNGFSGYTEKEKSRRGGRVVSLLNGIFGNPWVIYGRLGIVRSGPYRRRIMDDFRNYCIPRTPVGPRNIVANLATGSKPDPHPQTIFGGSRVDNLPVIRSVLAGPDPSLLLLARGSVGSLALGSNAAPARCCCYYSNTSQIPVRSNFKRFFLDYY